MYYELNTDGLDKAKVVPVIQHKILEVRASFETQGCIVNYYR